MSAPSDAEAAPSQSVVLVISAVAAVLLLAALGQSIVGTALPAIVGELGGLDHLTWVITAYLLSSTVVAPIYGKLGDLYGRKIVLQTAIVIFLGGAILSSIATSMTFLIVARAIQGLGGGGLLVVSMTVVADVIPARQRGRIQGIFGAVFGLATVIGPLLGGFFVDQLSWHWIFYINLPIGIAALVVIAIAFRVKPERAHHKIDYLGAALLTGTLSSVVLFTSLGGTTFAWSSPFILTLMAASVLMLAGFLFVETHAAEPVLPLDLFRNRTFVVSSSVLFIVGLAMFGAVTFLPLFLQTVVGMSPSASGMQLVPMMAGMFGTSIVTGQIMSRTGHYRWMPIAGTAVMVLGLAMMATLTADTSGWMISLFMLVFGIGLGPITSVATTAVQNAVRRDQLGVATAGVTLFRQIGGSLGVSAFGAVFSNGLAAELGSAVPEGGASAAFTPDALAALSPPARQFLLDAFTNALHPVFILAAVAGVGAFALTFLLKEIPLATTLRQEPEAEINAGEETAAAAIGAPAMPERA